MQTFRVEHRLSGAEAAKPGAEMNVRQAARRDVIRQARAEVGADLPQDHTIDEALRPDGDDGFVVEAVLTVP